MERIPGVGNRGPEIRVAIGSAGLVTMGSLSVVSDERRDEILETTDVTPFSMNKLVDGADRIGVPDQAVFVVLTILFGTMAMRGVQGLRNRRKDSGS